MASFKEFVTLVTAYPKNNFFWGLKLMLISKEIRKTFQMKQMTWTLRTKFWGIWHWWKVCYCSISTTVSGKYKILQSNYQKIWFKFSNLFEFHFFIDSDHTFSTYAKCSEKLNFLTPWYAHECVHIRGYEMLVFRKISRMS